MNGSKKELEERLAAQEKILRDLERSLRAAQRMIEETRKLLDEAKGAGGPKPPQTRPADE